MPFSYGERRDIKLKHFSFFKPNTRPIYLTFLKVTISIIGEKYTYWIMRDFRLPPRINWDLRPSGIIHSVDVSGQLTSPILKGQEVQKENFLAGYRDIGRGTDRRPETSVRNYKYTPRNIPEDNRPRLLKPLILWFYSPPYYSSIWLLLFSSKIHVSTLFSKLPIQRLSFNVKYKVVYLHKHKSSSA
jgi:hypothetical protein